MRYSPKCASVSTINPIGSLDGPDVELVVAYYDEVLRSIQAAIEDAELSEALADEPDEPGLF